MAKRMMGHSDEAADKKVFSSMMKKAMPKKKVMSHLKKDIKEQKHGMKKDAILIRSLKKKAK